MATRSAAGISVSAESPFCRPEEDPFLLLEFTLRSMEVILLCRSGLPLRRTWSEKSYGEEEITPPDEAQATTKFSPSLAMCITLSPGPSRPPKHYACSL